MARRRHHPARTDDSFAQVRGLMQAEAERHRPDRQRIWSQVEAAMGAPSDAHSGSGGRGVHARGARRRGRRFRLVAVPLAAACVVGVTSVVIWEFAGGGRVPAVSTADHGISQLQPTPAGTVRAPAPITPVPSASGQGAVTGSGRPVTPAPGARSTAPGAPGAPGDAAAPFSAGGTVDPGSRTYWAQNDVTVRVQRELRALRVIVRVDRTDRVEATGSWLTLRAEDFDISTKASGDTVTYEWKLRDGRTVAPGSYVLAAQYNRAADHDPRKDTYAVRGKALDGGDSVTMEGHF